MKWAHKFDGEGGGGGLVLTCRHDGPVDSVNGPVDSVDEEKTFDIDVFTPLCHPISKVFIRYR